MTDGAWSKDRPVMPGMGTPESLEGTMEWPDVVTKLGEAKNYWICTASETGVPHAVPMWAAFVNEKFFVGTGGRKTNRNLDRNPHVTIHLESGTDVVIVDGEIEPRATIDAETFALIEAQFQEKYDWKPSDEPGYDGSGEGWRIVRPTKVIAWTSFPSDATRWTRSCRKR
jgi:hypothetical protein